MKQQRKRVRGFAARLKLERLDCGWTQLDLAKKVGLTQSMIAYCETGRREPNLFHFRRLCIALDVSADYMFGDV